MGDSSELVIVLKGGECSDYIDFVVKDTSIDRWFDFNGDNFRVRLHEMAPSAPGKDALKTMDVQVCFNHNHCIVHVLLLYQLWPHVDWLQCS